MISYRNDKVRLTSYVGSYPENGYLASRNHAISLIEDIFSFYDAGWWDARNNRVIYFDQVVRQAKLDTYSSGSSNLPTLPFVLLLYFTQTYIYLPAPSID